MDRFTWAFIAGAIVICVLGIASTFYVRIAPAASPQSPSGVVSAYVQASHDRDADRAWGLLAPGASVGSAPVSEQVFRRQMATLPAQGTYSRLIRVTSAKQNGDSASVSVEVTTGEGIGPQETQELTFGLKKVDGMWKIDSSPMLYEIV